MKIRFTTAIYKHTGGLIRLYIVIWSVLSQFKWLLLFLHHAWRGRGTRLSIRTKDPNNYSDTETGTLSKLALTGGVHSEPEPVSIGLEEEQYMGYFSLTGPPIFSTEKKRNFYSF